MPYSYYSRLPAKDKEIYQASDRISKVNLQNSTELIPLVQKVGAALTSENRTDVKNASQRLATQLTLQFNIPSVKIKVLRDRPSNGYGELHGLYEPVSDKVKQAEISVWMRTAKRKQVVAFKTYMRTLLHELCHHFDYELYKLEDSFHTEGFFKRESSLYKQLVPQTAECPLLAESGH